MIRSAAYLRASASPPPCRACDHRPVSQIYFIVENQTPSKIGIYLRGAFPNIHNNGGPFEEIDPNSRKQLDHRQDRGYFALKFGYQARFQGHDDEGSVPVLIGPENDQFLDVGIAPFMNAPEGDNDVTLAVSNLSAKPLDVKVSGAMR